MIHYHGTPISPKLACERILRGRHAMVSFRQPVDLDIVLETCSTFVLDNGAFSAWKSGNPVTDWHPYYDFVFSLWKHAPATKAARGVVLADRIEINQSSGYWVGYEKLEAILRIDLGEW